MRDMSSDKDAKSIQDVDSSFLFRIGVEFSEEVVDPKLVKVLEIQNWEIVFFSSGFPLPHFYPNPNFPTYIVNYKKGGGDFS